MGSVKTDRIDIITNTSSCKERERERGRTGSSDGLAIFFMKFAPLDPTQKMYNLKLSTVFMLIERKLKKYDFNFG